MNFILLKLYIEKSLLFVRPDILFSLMLLLLCLAVFNVFNV